MVGADRRINRPEKAVLWNGKDISGTVEERRVRPQTRAVMRRLRCTQVSPCGGSCVLVDSAPSLGVYYVLSLTLSACPSVRLFVTLLLQIDSSLFLDGIEPFLAVISPCDTLQNVVLRFLI